MGGRRRNKEGEERGRRGRRRKKDGRIRVYILS